MGSRIPGIILREVSSNALRLVGKGEDFHSGLWTSDERIRCQIKGQYDVILLDQILKPANQSSIRQDVCLMRCVFRA